MTLSVTIGGTTINTTSTTKPYIKAKSIKISPRADNRNDCAFTVITTANTFLPRVGQDLRVTEGATVKFGGIVKTVVMERPGVGTGGDTMIFADVMSDGYSGIPAWRVVAPHYSSVIMAGDIVSHYVSTVLSEEGVTAGAIDDGATLARYIKPAISLKELLDELAESSGLKWWIDDSKQLHFTQEGAGGGA